MDRRRRWPVGISVLAVTAAVACLVVWVRANEGDVGDWSADGPVLLPHDHGYVVRYAAGDVFTDGFERIKLAGDEPGILHKVELVGPDLDHLAVIGVLLAGPHRKLGSY